MAFEIVVKALLFPILIVHFSSYVKNQYSEIVGVC